MSSTRLKRRPDGRFRVKIRYTDGNGDARETYVYDTDEAECKRKAEETRQRLRNGEPAKDSRDTLGGFAWEWIGSTLELNRKTKQSTKDWYTRLARVHIIGDPDNPRPYVIGETRLDQLTVTHVEKWMLGMQRYGLSESTVRGAYTTLHKILDSAVKKQAIRRNWAADVERPSVTPSEAAHLTPDEVAALLKAAEGSRYGLLLRLLVLTGLRRGEALALRWSDVRPKGRNVVWAHGTLARLDGHLTVTDPKTPNARREIFISDPLDAVLRALRVRQAEERLRAGSLWESTDYVFTTETGQPCDPRNALRAMYAAARAAGLSGVGLHTLRHSAATIMLDAGVPVHVVSRQLGHGSVSITVDIYGHVGEEASAQAMTALAAAVG